MGHGEEHDGGKPRGRAVVLDPRRVVIAPLWNEEILEPGFPRWQDGSTIDEEEYRRCGQAGYPFNEWLRKLLPAGSHIWQPPGAEAAESSDAGAGGRGVSVIGKGLRIGGLDGLKEARGGLNLVMAFNSVQSNFMAPYDFLVVGGKVVRQQYAVYERPLTGTACWVFQTSGVGPPRLLRVRLGDDDSLSHQAEADSAELRWRGVGVQTGDLISLEKRPDITSTETY
jgi:hypothetical protein